MKTLLFLTATTLVSFAHAGGSSIGPGNPAAYNCVKLKGTYEIVKTSGGQRGDCVVEQWQLFREMDKRGLVKEHDYSRPDNSIRMPNIAAVNCIDIGGELRYTKKRRVQKAFCVVDGWKLYRVINVLDEE